MDDIPLDGKDDHPSTSAATNTSFHFHVPSPPPLDDILAGIHGGMDLTSSALTGPTTRMSLSALPNPIESSDMASHMASDMATSTAITKASTAFGSTFGSALEAAYARGEHAPPPVEVLRMSNEVSAMTGASLTMPLNMTGATSSTPAAHSFYKAAVDFHGLDEDALLFQSIGVGGLGSGLGADLAQELNDKLALTKGKKSGALVDADGRERADDTDDDDDVDEEDDGEEQRNIAHVHTVKSPTTATRRFDWENPRPEQMLVCDQRQAAEILDSLTDQLKCPPPATGGSSSAKLALANTAFLMARYAHYYGGGDVLDVVLSGLVMRVDRLARAHAQDLSFCAHWLANAVWLLYYLRREPQLRESTGMYQKQISTLVQSIFQHLANNVRQRLDKVMVGGLLDFESIPGGDKIVYEQPRRQHRGRSSHAPSVLSRKTSQESIREDATTAAAVPSRPSSAGGLFSAINPFRSRSSSSVSSSASAEPSSSSSNVAAPTAQGTPATTRITSFISNLTSITSRPPPPVSLSPRSVTTVLSSVLFVLQCYEVPELLQSQLLADCFHWINVQLLNRLVDPVDPAVGTPRHYCTRWKAVCVRMNLSVLEDWVRVNTNATVTMTMDGDISPTASIQSPVSPMLQHLSKHSSMPGTSAAPATRERRGFEGLLQPLSHTHPDAITSYLSPLITAVQLLQIATTSFGESASPLHGQAMISKDAAANTTSLPDQVRWLHLILEAVGRETEALALFEIHMKGYAVPTSAAVGAGSSLLDQPLSSLASPGIGVDSLRASPTASKKSDIAPSMDHLLKLTLPQVHRLLVSNYWYERDESRLHPDVSGVLALLVDTMHSFSFDQQRLIGSGITGAQHESQGGPGKLLGYAPASPLALSTGANANTQTTITTQIEHLTMLLLQTTTSKPDSSLFEPIATRRWQLDTVRLQDTLAVLPRDGGDFLPSVVHDRMADVKLGRRIVAPEWVLTKLGGGRA